MTGRSVLVVPLPGLSSVVPRLSQAEGPVPHVTLLDPFALEPDPGTLAELAMFFADVLPFAVRLAGVSQFPGGSTYLTPEPSAPFRRLTSEITRLFPELPRPPASFDGVPHLTVPRQTGETLEDLQRELDPWLPVTVAADEASLWQVHDDAVRTVGVFPFGTSAA